ncbi:hypothetical protein Micbo1qcDRAFT_165309 [Microdochium bolleyi]|uniref:Uncharacterized protein n=1 Tax=Microdochium bolleyi TaxID=196109 RepID=A0A136IY66_9PEZI|nr:hypothetical protein Micbo1qcDRAFT_165309 [Microdochium bolleyi]
MDSPPMLENDQPEVAKETCFQIPTIKHILDPRGDLWIHTFGKGSWGSTDPARFLVCSRTLARASRAFDIMLYGGYSESVSRNNGQDKQDWVVKLPDDAAPAMKQLFEIMHCQFTSFEKVSGKGVASDDGASDSDAAQSPTILRQLYDLTVVANKYQAIGLLRPWTSVWLLALEPEDSDENELLRKAWIYHQLGYKEGYKRTGTKLATEFPPIVDHQHESQIPTLITPFHLIDTVTSLRLEMVHSLLEPLRNTATALLGSGSTTLGLCTEHGGFGQAQATNADRLDCESWMLGHLLRVLHLHELWPIPPDEDTHLSPSTLTTIVKGLAAVEATPNRSVKRHRRCVPSSASGSLGSRTYVLHEDEAAFMDKQGLLTDVAAYTPSIGVN